MCFPKLGQWLSCFALSLLLVGGCHRFYSQPSAQVAVATPPTINPAPLAGQSLVPLTQPGPWRDVTGLIGYGDRLWFANSVAFENHNSADIYSYSPVTGETRYEQHLFSQSVGQPLVTDGLLYWPFEDPRFSADLGEYMVTNGNDWQWYVLPGGEAFHLHTMAAYNGSLFAGTGAWAGRVLRSHDQGKTWQVVYEHPTPNRQVSRVTQLTPLDDQLYIGVTALQENGIKLFQWQQDTLQPVTDWPRGKRVNDLTAYNGWLYGINLNPDDSSTVWRTQGDQAEPVTGLDDHRIRALAAGPDELWAVSIAQGSGLLWHSSDGVAWTAVHQFESIRPMDVIVYAGNVYVGAQNEARQGVLLGPAAPASTSELVSEQTLTTQPAPLSPQQLQSALQQVDQVIADPASYANGNTQDVLSQALLSLALSGSAEAGEDLSERLKTSLPNLSAELFDNVVAEPAADVVQWYLLWAIGLNGHGRIPVELLNTPWTTPNNPREKYWQPTPAAAWAVAQIRQTDPETLTALVNRLSFEDDPTWLKGDFVGALSALTGKQFGYDEVTWQTWWAQQAILSN